MVRRFTPGTVVKNRTRLWRVDGVYGKIMVATSIDGGQTEQSQFYIPFEQIEEGHLPTPDPEIPGNPAAHELLLRAYRLSMLHGTAPLLSLQRSRVIPTNYQLIPVIMSLDMPRVRMAIFDDVGLGKTIEAGLIVSELIARQKVSRILVICPANLREQWKEAMSYFFHMDFRIISSRHRREMERELPSGANPWEFYRFLICSFDYARTARIRNQIAEIGWDLILVDEAHSLTKPHQKSPEQKVNKEQWILAQILREKSKHLLLLTATPHNGFTDSYASLLWLLDVGAVRGELFEPFIDKKVAKNYICQRRRKDIEEWFKGEGNKSPFPERDQQEITISPAEQEKKVYDLVENYRKFIADNIVDDKFAHYIAMWTALHLHKRALSSPMALRRSLKNRIKKLEEHLKKYESDEKDIAGITVETARDNVLDKDTGEQFDEEETNRRLERTVFWKKEHIEKELKYLEGLLEEARKIKPDKDSKLRDLIKRTLLERLKCDPKVIIFTKYKDTLEYLEKHISGDQRYKSVKILTLFGELTDAQRKERFLEFDVNQRAVLIATDCISEGINLQHSCCQIIHYELPWNPNRLEQRNGRVDRFGQKKPVVYIRTLVMDEKLDTGIAGTLVKKAMEIREQYGFSPPFFGDETDIFALMREHGHYIPYSGTTKIIGTGKKVQDITLPLPFIFDEGEEGLELQDPFNEHILKKISDESFYGQTDLKLDDIEKRLRETYETTGSPAEIEEFVTSGLECFKCFVDKKSDKIYNIKITNSQLLSISSGNTIEKATFDPKLALEEPDKILLDTGHGLVRSLIDLVKKECFTGKENYGRVVCVKTKGVSEITGIYHILARFMVNTDPPSIIEDFVPAGIPYGEEIYLPFEDVQKILKSAPVSGSIKEELWKELINDAPHLKKPDIIIEKALEEHMEKIIKERRAFKEKLQSRGFPSGEKWLEGIDDISLTSFDVLAITFYLPAGGAA